MGECRRMNQDKKAGSFAAEVNNLDDPYAIYITYNTLGTVNLAVISDVTAGKIIPSKYLRFS